MICASQTTPKPLGKIGPAAAEAVPVLIVLADASEDIRQEAFGLTNRPDELVHLVLDVLERTKSTVPFRD